MGYTADAVSVGSTHEASRWMCISSRDQWNLTPATMCRELYEAFHSFFFLGGGGGGFAINRQTAIFVAASPR